MNNIYKNFLIFFMSAPLLLSTSLKADGENKTYDSEDMRSSVSESSTVADYPLQEEGEDNLGATAFHSIYTRARPLDESSSSNSASVTTGVYNNGKTGESQYSDARVVLQAGLEANAMCSPCGAYLELYEGASGGRDASTRITYNAQSHSFYGGAVNIYNDDGASVNDVAGTINTNTAGIATNVTNIATNTTNIATNTTNIATNTADIATNKTNIATNTADIATNVTNIATNTAGIATNVTNIATNTAGIATNVTNIASNTAGIATNVTNIATNTAGIATNGLNISTNTNGIASNLALIGSNTSNIQSLSTSFANFQVDTRQNFATLSSNTHRGLAEVTAISNVAYASSGWRASIGYGNYESKSATAIGVSFAGENAKFKISTSGDAMGMGISFDF